MKRSLHARLLCLCMIALTALLALGTAGAAAETSNWLCVPNEAGATATSGGSGAEAECKGAVTAVKLPPPAEMATLNEILPHISYEASGVAKKPTVRFTGVNVQVVNGEGKTATINGEGNLIIGYAERGAKPEAKQTGSHDLVVGTREEFTSYGGIVAGEDNAITGAYASGVAGRANTASGEGSSVTGGESNKASGVVSSVTGGESNKASGIASSVTGGWGNKAEGDGASIAGGESNAGSSVTATVSGGSSNNAHAPFSWIGGGYKNLTEGEYSSIFGGKELTAKESYEAIP